ncbi:hypothetical protein WICMUC_000747 [Wickerhamomyces mucosus]|uniref:Methyltransferase small domain-containing protein n=1 Tax=Wickerhamomyces mucosus TaxID=1378264 RepID=A0A9P8TIK8_9ASCO|nr:hypothetical protein WICMUC_000747 [Wickerhamomyces mucosus]
MLPTPIVSADFNKVYEPSEDSFLLLDSFEKDKELLNKQFFKTPIVLEIGTGSGIITTFIHKHILPNGLFLTTDLNPHACKTCLETSLLNDGTQFLDTIQTNLTDSIRSNLIDILIFNPPYVPDEIVPEIPQNDDDSYEWLDLALLGGEDGMIVTNVLLDNLDNILSSNGIAYILFCARNKPLQVVQKMKERGWNYELVMNRKTGEDLSVYKFQRS